MLIKSLVFFILLGIEDLFLIGLDAKNNNIEVHKKVIILDIFFFINFFYCKKFIYIKHLYLNFIVN